MKYENYIVYPDSQDAKQEMDDVNRAVEIGGRVHSVHYTYGGFESSYPTILYVIEWKDE